MTTTYQYTTKKGNKNIEVFDTKGYVTLTRDGVHIYEHQFSTLGVQLQEIELLKQFAIHDIEFTKTINEE